VQGDNLVALKALLPYYAGQVKCIYIDPPYNTGNEGWIYNGQRQQPAHPRLRCRIKPKNPDKHPLGPWKATPLHAKSGTDASAYIFKNGVVWTPPAGTFRRFNDASMERMDANKEIYFGAKGTAVPSRKTFLGSLSEGLVPVTFWTHEAVGDDHIGRDEVKSALKASTNAFDKAKCKRACCKTKPKRISWRRCTSK
jgi:hypothetical protein